MSFIKRSNNQKSGGDGQRRQGGNDRLKVEKRDQSKGIKKAIKGQKKISIESLRKENKKNKLILSKKGGNKGGDQKNGQKGDRRQKKGGLGGRQGKRGRFNKKGAKPKDPQDLADQLDKELEGYWVKGGCSEFGKQLTAIEIYY